MGLPFSSAGRGRSSLRKRKCRAVRSCDPISLRIVGCQKRALSFCKSLVAFTVSVSVLSLQPTKLCQQERHRQLLLVQMVGASWMMPRALLLTQAFPWCSLAELEPSSSSSSLHSLWSVALGPTFHTKIMCINNNCKN